MPSAVHGVTVTVSWPRWGRVPNDYADTAAAAERARASATDALTRWWVIPTVRQPVGSSPARPRKRIASRPCSSAHSRPLEVEHHRDALRQVRASIRIRTRKIVRRPSCAAPCGRALPSLVGCDRDQPRHCGARWAGRWWLPPSGFDCHCRLQGQLAVIRRCKAGTLTMGSWCSAMRSATSLVAGRGSPDSRLRDRCVPHPHPHHAARSSADELRARLAHSLCSVERWPPTSRARSRTSSRRTGRVRFTEAALWNGDIADARAVARLVRGRVKREHGRPARKMTTQQRAPRSSGTSSRPWASARAPTRRPWRYGSAGHPPRLEFSRLRVCR